MGQPRGRETEARFGALKRVSILTSLSHAVSMSKSMLTCVREVRSSAGGLRSGEMSVKRSRRSPSTSGKPDRI